MAAGTTYTPAKSLAVHKTLVGGNYDTVNIRARYILVENRDPALDIYLTLDGSTVPVAGADDTYIVRANSAKLFSETTNVTAVILISTGAAAYSVEGHS